MNRIYLVDHHPIVRFGLTVLIGAEKNLVVCAETDSARHALSEIPRVRPDLVILEMALPDMSGLELMKELQALVPELPLLAFSDHDEMLYAERAIKAGALGYVRKTAPNATILDAIRQTLAGNVFFNQTVTNHLLRSMAGRTNGHREIKLEALTDREIEVFELIGLGKSTHTIADQLCICLRTVEAHRTHIREKLALTTAAEVIRHAVMWVESEIDA